MCMASSTHPDFPILVELIQEAIGPDYYLDVHNEKPWQSMYIWSAKIESSWCVAVIQWVNLTFINISYGYSDSRQARLDVSDPEFSHKMRAIADEGWNLCPNHAYYIEKYQGRMRTITRTWGSSTS